MRELYEQLYERCNNKSFRWAKENLRFSDLSHFVSMKGREYDKQDVRLLVIGRAVNGWEIDKERKEKIFSDAKKYGDYIEESLKNGFSWVDRETLISRYKTTENGKEIDGEYNLTKSSFWRTTQQIWRDLPGNKHSNEYFWLDYIAWTNLYKVSPPETGNPSLKMIKEQSELCKEILQKEIEYYNPTHILIITGYEWWFAKTDNQSSSSYPDFSSIFHQTKALDKETSDIIEGYAIYRNKEGRDIPAAITSRPERKKDDEFVAAVVSFFKSIAER